MNYGVLSGGKKLDQALFYLLAKLFNLKSNKVINICGAVECIHSYSLNT